MNFRAFRFLSVLLLVILVSGCFQQSENLTRQRIICLSPGYTEVLYALGLENQIVGWTQYCNYPPEVQEVPGWVRYDHYKFVSNDEELKKQVAVVSRFVQINMALIDSLKPTLILSSHNMQRKAANELQSKGYNVLHFSPKTLDETFQMMEKIGKETGTLDIAKKLIRNYRQEIEQIRNITSNLPKLRVYFEINHMGPYVLGSGSPMDQMIEIAGGVNIFSDIEGDAFRATLTDIVEKDPDIILTPLWPAAGREEVTTIHEIVTRPGFSDITAVKNSRVYHYDSSLLKRPGPRTVSAIKKLAYLLHPYHFKNPPDSADPWELGKIDETYPPEKALR